MDYIDALPLYMAIADALPAAVPIDIVLKIASYLTVTLEFSFENRGTTIYTHDPLPLRLNLTSSLPQGEKRSVRELQELAQPFSDFTYPPTTPRLNAIEHGGYLVSVESAAVWNDQGWGNKKASIFVSVARDCLLSAYLHGRHEQPDGLHGIGGSFKGTHDAWRIHVKAGVASLLKEARRRGCEDVECDHGFRLTCCTDVHRHNSHDENDEWESASDEEGDAEKDIETYIDNLYGEAVAVDISKEWRTVWHSRLLFCDRKNDLWGEAVSRHKKWETKGYFANAAKSTPQFEGGLVRGDELFFSLSPGAGGGHSMSVSNLLLHVEFAVGELVPFFLCDFIDRHRHDKKLRTRLSPRPDTLERPPSALGSNARANYELLGPMPFRKEDYLLLD